MGSEQGECSRGQGVVEADPGLWKPKPDSSARAEGSGAETSDQVC